MLLSRFQCIVTVIGRPVLYSEDSCEVLQVLPWNLNARARRRDRAQRAREPQAGTWVGPGPGCAGEKMDKILQEMERLHQRLAAISAMFSQ
jgi:hypothetical protein